MRRSGARRRLRSARLIAGSLFLAVLATGCRPPQATPTPSASAATPTPTPGPVSGEMGSPVTLGALTILVRGAGDAPPDLQTYGAEMRLVEVLVTVSALGGPVQLDAAQVQLVDDADGTRYGIASDVLPGGFTWPLALPAGTATDGTLGFTIPMGGRYQLRVAPSAGLVAEISLGSLPDAVAMVPLPSASPVATPTPSEPPSPSPAPSAAPTPTPGATAIAYSAARAKAYQDSVATLYLVTLPDYATAMRRASTASAADRIARGAIGAIDSHLAALAARPAPPCYEDAYAADRQMAKLWRAAFALRKQGDYAGAQARSDQFVTNLLRYFSDCR